MALNLRSLYGPAQPAAPLVAAPTGVATPTASGTGTSVTAAQKWFVLTFANQTGETVASATVTVTPAAGNTITLTSPAWPANMLISKTNVYEGTASAGPFYFQGSITTSGGTLAVTTEPSTSAAQPPATGTAIQPVLIGTVGTASGSGATAWLSGWTDVYVKSIILGNADVANKATMSVLLVRSGNSLAPGYMLVPVKQVDTAGNVGKANEFILPFHNLNMQTGDALWALQHQAGTLVILTIEGGAKP